MRSLWTVVILAMVCALSTMSGPAARAQTVVTMRGTVQSLDSSRANVLIRSSGGQERLIVLPADVPVSVQGNATRKMRVDDLAEGTVITVDAVKGPTGQVTARRVVIIPPADGNISPTGPTPANKVTIQPSRGTSSGVVVTSDAATTGSRFIAARANLLNQPVGALHVNGRTVFRFRGIHGEDPYVRAQVVAARLNSPAMANLRPEEVQARVVGRQWAVVARGNVLITADPMTAHINGTSPRRLASVWAANMRAQLRAS
jgi:hypothetical protein